MNKNLIKIVALFECMLMAVITWCVVYIALWFYHYEQMIL